MKVKGLNNMCTLEEKDIHEVTMHLVLDFEEECTVRKVVEMVITVLLRK